VFPCVRRARQGCECIFDVVWGWGLLPASLNRWMTGSDSCMSVTLSIFAFISVISTTIAMISIACFHAPLPAKVTFSNTVKRFNIDCQLSSTRPLVSDLRTTSVHSATGSGTATRACWNAQWKCRGKAAAYLCFSRCSMTL
jgi:hypothetical protein